MDKMISEADHLAAIRNTYTCGYDDGWKDGSRRTDPPSTATLIGIAFSLLFSIEVIMAAGLYMLGKPIIWENVGVLVLLSLLAMGGSFISSRKKTLDEKVVTV